MKKGIVITTSESSKQWLPECLESLNGVTFPIYVVSNMYNTPLANIVNNWNGFELGGIFHGAYQFDEFLYIPDTVIIKNVNVVNEIMDIDDGVMISPGFLSYIGKYRSDVIHQVGITRVYSKLEAVTHERVWTRKYIDADKSLTVYEEMIPSDTGIIKEKNGRQNMLNECGWAAKFKGCWSMDQIK